MGISIWCVDAQGRKYNLQFNGDWTCEVPDGAKEFTLFDVFPAYPARRRGQYAAGSAVGTLDCSSSNAVCPPYELRIESKDFGSLKELYMGIRTGELKPTISFEKEIGPDEKDRKIAELEQSLRNLEEDRQELRMCLRRICLMVLASRFWFGGHRRKVAVEVMRIDTTRMAFTDPELHEVRRHAFSPA